MGKKIKTLVIKNPYGGLGDHLFMSHLPRVAKESGVFDKVVVTNSSKFLNPETKHLVWELNPFFDGFVDDDVIYPQFGEVTEGKNLLDAVSDFYGVPDTGIRFQEPEVYYKPKLIPELKDAIILEWNSFSGKGIPNQKTLRTYFKNNSVAVTHQMKSLFRKSAPFDVKTIHADNLCHLCDIIYSCKHFYGVLTGSITLAAAIRKPSTVLYVDGALSMFRHSKLHTYIHL